MLQLKKPLVRNYSSGKENPVNTDNAQYNPVKFYSNAYDMRKLILKENKNKPGIYKINLKLNILIFCYLYNYYPNNIMFYLILILFDVG